MPKVIISDTSCIIILDKISELEILQKLYGEVIVTSIIAEEYGKQLPGWIKIKNPTNENYQNIISLDLDVGEASAIALALDEEEPLLILDDEKARKVAIGLGLEITGTIGIIINAKKANLIPSVKEIMKKIKQTNFRISESLEQEIIKKAGE